VRACGRVPRRSLESNPLKSLSLAIVGVDYPNKRGPGRRFELELCAPGELIELRPEPKNPKDEYAISVYSCRGVQLGYITAERAPWIGAHIRAGREVRAIFQGKTDTAGWMRLAFDGEDPVLPPARDTKTDVNDDGFYPDEIYPDD
jgi:hypothetical protein